MAVRKQRRYKLFKRGKTFWVEYYDARGERRRESTAQTDRTLAGGAAERLVRERHGLLERPPLLMVDAIANFIASRERLERSEASISYYRKKAKPLIKFFDQRDLRTIVREDSEAYVEARSAESKGNGGGLAKELSLLRSCLAAC